ncbi:MULTISPECIES: membrane protein [Corynebacterium]|uniref:Uncharacterized protein n=2 Tax=Corynebacterium TaxID=1716 RepID=A0A553G4Z9_9CORY|nr:MULTISPECIES: membrane protein [Corynebacterium]MTD92351.1 hypothetical protein [Corynebacterium aurimucosum]OFK68124.1 hypothetical protein HMPREF2806_07725 [Corynebacterium sp. HMSC076G08]OFN33273.1 hypothetical protein HMPREF2565_01740 [Corynebacterium sp. HMSC072A04]OFN79156.1 hypothetical protein HMPREF2526_07535 [Corynebacterium sp. HMSC070E08]OFO99117.1 hypothetical protein HMPREF3009_01490 [Corynebacterium sp. HMSC034H07]
MSDLNPAVADHHSETYPEFSGKIQDSYIEGYDPVSYSAPHSSLLRTSTWVGMGLVLSILPALGILIWGFGTKLYPQGTAGADYQINLIVGAIASVVVAILAIVSVKYGRRYYRQYRKETGRIN